MVFEHNLGPRLSLDETALPKGKVELNAIITNNDAKCKNGSLVAIIGGTQSEVVIQQIPSMSQRKRIQVMRNNIGLGRW